MHRVSKVQRSKTGCWTCRLRRKKCNEGGPPCENCESRGVFCHGYGPKPPWKDRGEKEKQQASILRLQPRQHRSHSKTLSGEMIPQSFARSASIDFSECNHEMNAPVVNSPSQSDLSSSSFTVPQDPQAFAILDNLETFDLWDVAGASNDFWLSSSSAETLVGCHDVQPPIEDLPSDSTDAPDSSRQPASSEYMLSLSSAVELSGSQSSATGLQSDHPNEPIGFPSDKAADIQPPTGDPRHRPTVCLAPAAGAQMSTTDEQECELFMHFIGETFALQHTSYRAASTIQRSWLLFLLMRSPTFYYASLSMSAYHYYLSVSGDSDVRTSTFQAYQKYRTCALTRFSELLKSDQHSVSPYGSLPGEHMICGVQIALLEVRKSSTTSSTLGL